MPVKKINRRYFLQGLGGSLLLPMMPSIVGDKAFAQMQNDRLHQAWIIFRGDNGGVHRNNIAPNPNQITSHPFLLNQNRTYKKGSIQNAANATGGSYSPVLSGVFQQLYNDMNVFFTDYPTVISHNRANLGCMAAQNNGSDHVPSVGNTSADYQLWHYFRNSAAKQIVLSSADSGNITRILTDHNNLSSSIVEASPYHYLNNIYQQFFQNNNNNNTNDQNAIINSKRSVLDFVLGDLTRLNNRLGLEDRQVLQNFENQIRTIEQGLGEVTNSCNNPSFNNTILNTHMRDLDANNSQAWMETLNDMIIALITCGSLKTLTLNLRRFNGDQGGGTGVAGSLHWHSHNNSQASSQNYLVDYFSKLYQWGPGDLALKMKNTTLPNGKNMLDECLVHATLENTSPHNCYATPTVTLGKAGGAFQTGSWLDHGQADLSLRRNTYSNEETKPAGINNIQFLANVLRSFGVPPQYYKNFKNLNNDLGLDGGGAGHLHKFIAGSTNAYKHNSYLEAAYNDPALGNFDSAISGMVDPSKLANN